MMELRIGSRAETERARGSGGAFEGPGVALRRKGAKTPPSVVVRDDPVEERAGTQGAVIEDPNDD